LTTVNVALLVIQIVDGCVLLLVPVFTKDYAAGRRKNAAEKGAWQ